MGMYTGLRGKILLNDLGKRVAASDFNWESFTDIAQLREFAKDGRSAFIPYGAHCYMPSQWGEAFNCVHNGVLSFSCSLKNYEGTIEKFIETVVPVIGDAWVLESLYEEDDVPTRHENKTLDNWV